MNGQRRQWWRGWWIEMKEIWQIKPGVEGRDERDADNASCNIDEETEGKGRAVVKATQTACKPAHTPSPPLPGVKWCRHTLQPQTGLNKEDPEACGKVPGTTSVDQEPTVSCPLLKAISIASSMLQHEWSLALGGISAAAPDTEQISARTPCCWGPVDVFLRWSGEYLMSIVESRPLSSSPPADWHEVSIRPIPGSPRRELLSTSNMDSLNTEGSAVARRGQEESLNQELTNSTVGGDVTVMVQAS
ncbi:hypothetical protein L3Q82_023885 [Scortum barcoo]|uniref:Uncharacterized protein n=1 Tax=Scortum barcoo TaxID=214431 RepID=A0ACB8WTX4_9TELE|nr:hypothetical protein L3Q82_023885 [Scortum barcoo]